jgi:hypothetical protein
MNASPVSGTWLRRDECLSPVSDRQVYISGPRPMYMLFQREGEETGKVAEHVAMPQQLISVLLQDCTLTGLKLNGRNSKLGKGIASCLFATVTSLA